MIDLISRQMAMDTMMKLQAEDDEAYGCHIPEGFDGERAKEALEELPSLRPTLYGYDIEHLEMVARILQKEDLPPERVAEALTDINRIAAIIKAELNEPLRKAGLIY